MPFRIKSGPKILRSCILQARELCLRERDSDWLWNTGGPSYEGPSWCRSGCYQALAPSNPAVAPVTPSMLSFNSVSHKCSNFFNVIMPSTPTPSTLTLQQFSVHNLFGKFLHCSWFISPVKTVKRPKNRESRNIYRLKFGCVGVEGMMTLRKFGARVQD